MIRVLVVRDGGYFGIQVRVLLSAQPGIEVVGTLPMDHDVAARAVPFAPHVVVVDSELMVSQVLPTAAELRARIASCSVLVLCDPTKPGMLPPRRRGGEISFLLKEASPAYLADSVRRLAAGERIVHPRLQAASLNTERGLSTRELEVLGLAAEGDSVDDIAKRLYLSGGTVRNYLSSVIYKTGARNRLDAIRIVRKDGWLR
ncbi:response regulator transcription factor [Actinoplanes sp. NPDC049316]|uniref:response regulator transcription factor n=1 Tax=Actinoplanes sp. NPDC049316 TaxID=3154727 RepID=UPI0034341638